MSEKEMEKAVSEHVEKMDEEYLREKFLKFGYSDEKIEREIQHIIMGREQKLLEEKEKETFNHLFASKLKETSEFHSRKVSFDEKEEENSLRLVS